MIKLNIAESLTPKVKSDFLGVRLALALLVSASLPQLMLFAERLSAQEVERTSKVASNVPQSAKVASRSNDLDRWIEIALANNYDIKKSEEAISRQIGRRIEARSLFVPQLGASGLLERADQGTSRLATSSATGPDSSWSAAIEVSQSLYAGGRNIAGYRQADRLTEAAEFDLRAVVRKVVLDVKERYYAVLLARAQILVQEGLIKLREEELKSETQRRGAETVSDFNVLRAQVELANSKAPYIRSKNSLRLAIEDLNRVLGLPSKESAAIYEDSAVSGELSAPFFSIDLDRALKLALEQRPELTALKKIVDARQESLQVARAGHMPEVDAFGNYNTRNDLLSNSLSDDVHGWTVGIRASWKLFDGLATEGRSAQALAELNIARRELEQAQVDIAVEVRRAYSSFLEAQELVSASKKVVQEASESLRLANARMEAGVATQLDILSSQVALTDARTNEVQALHDYNVAVAQVVWSIGEDIKN